MSAAHLDLLRQRTEQLLRVLEQEEKLSRRLREELRAQRQENEHLRHLIAASVELKSE